MVSLPGYTIYICISACTSFKHTMFNLDYNLNVKNNRYTLNKTYLYGTELFMDDLNHSFNLFGSDRPCSALFSEQVHDVGGELVASLVILLQLLVVNVPI